MAVVSHVSFFSVCFSKFSFTEQLQLHNKKQLKLGWCNNHILRPRRGQCTLCACSVKESRSSRKVKSNEELCNDIKEFTKGVGLPDGHVPSMKELTQHGRNDLAYIVRRRGYKLLKELLANSTNTEGSEIGAEKSLTSQVQNYDKPVEEMPIMENFSSGLKVDPALNPCEYNYMPVESPVSSSLVEKVAKFIQNGDLDVLDDSSDVVLSESDVGESNELIELENATKTQLRTSEEAHSEELVDGGYTAMTMNGSALTSMQDVSSATVNPSSGIDQFSAEGLAGQIDKDLDVETSRREKQIEISHLKFMLHQKELELSRLKEQIEKEKLALSVLQTKAETEILNAQKLISEKDAELHAAEESLSGLTEVQIQYCGDGKIVEVAGSFNGWHHQIKMDLNPSSNIADSIGSRKRRWTTMLWLYPGIYEIKFIVDGHWRADPQRESVTRGTICNNILRVER